MAGMLQRLSRGLRTGFAVALLMVAGYAMAQGVRGDHPDTYVVVRGDTLWDLAGTFLQHPWLCERKSVGWGKRVYVRVNPAWARDIQKYTYTNTHTKKH